MRIRAALLVPLALAALALDVKKASACSCMQMNVRVFLAEADGAFVGTLLSRGQAPLVGGVADSSFQVPFFFEVDTVVRGDIPNPVTIKSSLDSASCGLGVAVGDKVGLLVYDSGDGTLNSSLCSQTDPATLLAGAAPLPPPDGSGPIKYLVGGNFGGVRIMALDDQGRTLAYGYGEGAALALNVCPGERFLVEAHSGRDGAAVTVRDVASLKHVATPLRLANDGSSVARLACLDAEAGSLAAFTVGPSAAIVVVDHDASRMLWQGAAVDAYLGRSIAVIAGGERGQQPVLVDYATGAATSLAPVDFVGDQYFGQWVPSPNGSWLASVGSRWGASSEVILVDTSSSTPRYERVEVGGQGVTGEIVWTNADEFAFLSAAGEAGPTVLFDTDLSVRGTWEGWVNRGVQLAGDQVVAASWGSLMTASVFDGNPRVLRKFDSPDLFAVAVVEDGPEAVVVTTTTPPPTATTPSTPSSSDPAAGRSGLPWVTGAAVSVLAVVGWMVMRRRP